MAHKSYKDESRKDWGTSADLVNLDQINTGALLRIADAAEAMATEHTKLIRDNRFLRDDRRRLNARVEFLGRSNASLRGQITKLKKRMATTVEGAPLGENK